MTAAIIPALPRTLSKAFARSPKAPRDFVLSVMNYREDQRIGRDIIDENTIKSLGTGIVRRTLGPSRIKKVANIREIICSQR